jgi:hypothetical protein
MSLTTSYDANGITNCVSKTWRMIAAPVPAASAQVITVAVVMRRVTRRAAWGAGAASGQGLTLVHFSAQLEPFLTQNTL